MNMNRELAILHLGNSARRFTQGNYFSFGEFKGNLDVLGTYTLEAASITLLVLTALIWATCVRLVLVLKF